MTKYEKSPWIDQYPASRVPTYPAQRGPIETDVAIIGGGLTGCTVAYVFAVAGVKVVLLEAERIGRGSTAAAIGSIADDPGASFAEIEKALGLRAARHAFQTWRRAALDFAALLRRLNIKCNLQPRPAVHVATTPEQAAALERERKARRHGGLDAPLINARAIRTELALEGHAAIRHKDDATLDPYRACLGIAAAAAGRGAVIFERSPVRRVKFGRRSVEVSTARGAVRASRVVVATGTPTALFSSLVRHFSYRTSYLALTEPVPAKIRSQLGRRASIIRDWAAPSHIVRWFADDRVLVCGADMQSAAPRHRKKVVVQRTGQLMYELSTLYPDLSGILPAYGWDAAYARTVDGLPYVGPHRNFPRHLFALGDASRSVTGAYLASRILLRHHLEAPEPMDGTFEFTRYGR